MSDCQIVSDHRNLTHLVISSLQQQMPTFSQILFYISQCFAWTAVCCITADVCLPFSNYLLTKSQCPWVKINFKLSLSTSQNGWKYYRTSVFCHVVQIFMSTESWLFQGLFVFQPVNHNTWHLLLSNLISSHASVHISDWEELKS